MLRCVRDRRDEHGHRLTTVELVVDRVPVNRRSADRTVGVRVRYEESSLRSTVRASGAAWDKAAKLWRMPFEVAVALGLRDRIVEDA